MIHNLRRKRPPAPAAVIGAPQTHDGSTDMDSTDSKPYSETGTTQHKHLLNRIEPTELRRRLWHMLPGLLPFLLWPIPHQDPISPTLYAIIIVVVVGLAITIFVGYRRIERSGEQNERFSAVTGYAASVLLTLLIFPGDAELGLTVLAVLAFGDGSATLGGLLLRGPTLPWNHHKTVAGFLCFLIGGGLSASIVYWGETHNLEATNQPATLYTAMFCGVSATLAAAIAESLPSRVNDNIRVGFTAALAVTTVHGLLAGWWW